MGKTPFESRHLYGLQSLPNGFILVYYLVGLESSYNFNCMVCLCCSALEYYFYDFSFTVAVQVAAILSTRVFLLFSALKFVSF